MGAPQDDDAKSAAPSQFDDWDGSNWGDDKSVAPKK
jgi:hypothetical protein